MIEAKVQPQQVSADMLVTMIGEQAIEIRVLRAQNAQLSQAVAAASEHMKKMQEATHPAGGLGGQGGPGGPTRPSDLFPADDTVAPDCAGVQYEEAPA